jgi:integrase/recombinase XerD
MKLAEAIGTYVAMKQMTGISFKWGTKVLWTFCRLVGDVSLDTIDEGHVSTFLDRSALSDMASFLRHRLLRAFFEYWVARSELATLPLPPLRYPSKVRTAVPYIYSVSELRQLLKAASMKRRATPRDFSSLTFRTVLLFLYATGARMNETTSLTQQDIDLRKGTVTFDRRPPAGKRTIPIGSHLCRSLREYDGSFAYHGERAAFFTRRDGKPVRAMDLTVNFQKLRRTAGIARTGGNRSQPKIRDLRRTFAVHCMRAWLKEGKDLRAMLPVLGAYLGHASLSSTEAYLAVTPERFLRQLSILGKSHMPLLSN